MSVYYIAGYPVSDELYHHGIKGQKWGVRRYQNDDGTLTAAGKARYGKEGLGKNNPSSILRRAAIGDFALGLQRHRAKREERLKNAVQKAKADGDKEKAAKKESRYNAQKQKNIDIEKYVSRTSTGKLWAQNLLMTGVGADSYRASRASGASRGEAFVDAILPRINLNPLSNETITQKFKDKRKYGDIAHAND